MLSKVGRGSMQQLVGSAVFDWDILLFFVTHNLIYNSYSFTEGTLAIELVSIINKKFVAFGHICSSFKA